MSITNEDANEKVNDLLDLPANKLTTWESNFIDDMTGKEEFSERQREVIDDIWGKFYWNIGQLKEPVE